MGMDRSLDVLQEGKSTNSDSSIMLTRQVNPFQYSRTGIREEV